jgi:DNA-binding LacI/PurR family transcriptional regulator
VDSFIERKIPFNAIMAGEDITALGALKRLQTLGYRIPEDVSVVGFNNSIFSQCAEPELTTVDTQMYDRLSLAVRLLYDVLNGKAIPPTTLFIPQLLIKGSS